MADLAAEGRDGVSRFDAVVDGILTAPSTNADRAVPEDFYGTPGTCAVCKIKGVRTVVLLEEDRFHGCYACVPCYVGAVTEARR